MMESLFLKIVFYLAMLFLPAGSKQFVASTGDIKETWVLQADGAWRATAADGQDGGLWSLQGSALTITRATGNPTKTEMSKAVKGGDAADPKTAISVYGRPVTVETGDAKVTLTQLDGGLFSQPVVITYSK